jgi:exodeoxyribonuclease VII small subunit
MVALPPTYREAMKELQEIVRKLRETQDLDVDELVADVTRARDLLDFCDGKIARADVVLQEIVAQLEQRSECEAPHRAVAEERSVRPGRNGSAEDLPF